MNSYDQSRLAGHTDFINRVVALLSNKRAVERHSLGEKPAASEEAAVADWMLKNSRINQATSIIKNTTKMRLNDFSNEVMSELVRRGTLPAITGLTDQNIKEKVESITDLVLKPAVEGLYDQFKA